MKQLNLFKLSVLFMLVFSLSLPSVIFAMEEDEKGNKSPQVSQQIKSQETDSEEESSDDERSEEGSSQKPASYWQSFKNFLGFGPENISFSQSFGDDDEVGNSSDEAKSVKEEVKQDINSDSEQADETELKAEDFIGKLATEGKKESERVKESEEKSSSLPVEDQVISETPAESEDSVKEKQPIVEVISRDNAEARVEESEKKQQDEPTEVKASTSAEVRIEEIPSNSTSGKQDQIPVEVIVEPTVVVPTEEPTGDEQAEETESKDESKEESKKGSNDGFIKGLVAKSKKAGKDAREKIQKIKKDHPKKAKAAEIVAAGVAVGATIACADWVIGKCAPDWQPSKYLRKNRNAIAAMNEWEANSIRISDAEETELILTEQELEKAKSLKEDSELEKALRAKFESYKKHSQYSQWQYIYGLLLDNLTGKQLRKLDFDSNTLNGLLRNGLKNPEIFRTSPSEDAIKFISILNNTQTEILKYVIDEYLSEKLIHEEAKKSNQNKTQTTTTTTSNKSQIDADRDFALALDLESKQNMQNVKKTAEPVMDDATLKFMFEEAKNQDWTVIYNLFVDSLTSVQRFAGKPEHKDITDLLSQGLIDPTVFENFEGKYANLVSKFIPTLSKMQWECLSKSIEKYKENLARQFGS